MPIQPISNPGRVSRAILTFAGWPDAGNLCRFLYDELDQLTSFKPAAQWDLDGYWTVDGLRPTVDIRHGQIHRLSWPRYDFYRYPAGSEKSVILGFGPEPTTRWKDFSQSLLAQLNQWSCRKVLLLGSQFDQVFHDEVHLTAVVQDVRGYNLARHWQCQAIDYQGPSAVHSALMEDAAQQNISMLCVWAHLPFYLKEVHELVTHRLLEIIGEFTGQQWRLGHLLGKWRQRLEQIETLLDQEPELLEQLKKLRNDQARPTLLQRNDQNIVRIDEFRKRKGDPPTDAP